MSLLEELCYDVRSQSKNNLEKEIEKCKENKYAYRFKKAFTLKDLFSETNSDGLNVLHIVCLYNTDDVATWMLSLSDEEKNPIPRISDKYGATAVMYAARSGMVTFVKEWIKQGCDIMSVDKHGRNILHYCCGAGAPGLYSSLSDLTNNKNYRRKALAHLFMDKGINYSCVDKKGILPIQYSVNLKFDKFLDVFDTNNILKGWKYIYERVLLGTKPFEACGGLMHMAVAECFIGNFTNSNREKISKLEKRIAHLNLSLNETDDKEMTVLHHLCYFRFDSEPYGLREGLVARLLELGADPNMKDIRGYTPLMCAIEKGYAIKYDPFDPRSENEKGIGKMLKVHTDISVGLNTETQISLLKQIEHIEQKMMAQEDAFRKEIEKINADHSERETSIRSSNDDLRKEICSLKESRDAQENAYSVLQENLNKHTQKSNKMNS